MQFSGEFSRASRRLARQEIIHRQWCDLVDAAGFSGMVDRVVRRGNPDAPRRSHLSALRRLRRADSGGIRMDKDGVVWGVLAVPRGEWPAWSSSGLAAGSVWSTARDARWNVVSWRGLYRLE